METYEQKEAWVMNESNAEIYHGTLLLKNGNPYLIIGKDDCRTIKEYYQVYYSEEKAKIAAKEYKQHIKDLCRRVKKDISDLECVSSSLAKQKDYLPGHFLNRSSDLEEYLNLYYWLTNYIQNGTININAVSFTKESVSHVNWGETAAEIVLNNGQKINTYDDIELKFVRSVFGINNGGRYFTEIKPEKEEEDD